MMRSRRTELSLFRSVVIGSILLLTAKAKATSVVDYQSLQKAGLTGGGVTIQINAYGVRDLQAAENAGILDPSQITVVNPNPTNNGAYPDRAVYSAITVHMVAPDANIVICNAAPDSCYGSDYSGANIVVDENADQVLGEDFSYGDTASDSRNLYHVPDFAADPNVLYFLSAGDIYGNDLYGRNYFGGKWLPVAATVGGKAATAWDFGAVAGNNSDPSTFISTNPPSTAVAPVNIDLQWEDPNSSDTPGFEIKVYSDGTNTLIADSVNGPSQCTSGHSLCVHIPQESYQTYPLVLYVINNGQPILGDARLKMFFRPDPGIATDPNSLPIQIDYVTGGSVTPFIPTAGPNAIVVKSGYIESLYDSSTGPELAFDSQTGQYKQFHYPTIAADRCLDIQQAPNMNNYFCGNAAATSELGGIAALLLQAGLSPGQIEVGEDETAVNIAGQANSGNWNAKNGYGYIDPLSVLTRFAPLATPKIYGPSKVEVEEGHAHTYYGLCTAPTGYTVTKYLWNFGDGTQAQGQTVVDTTHTFNSMAPYPTTLRCVEKEPNGQLLTDVTPAAVNTDVFQNSSLAQLSADTDFPQAGQAMNFTATCMPTATGDLTAWTLSFGDGSTSTVGKLSNYGSGFKVKHVYAKANAKGDFYTATLTCVQNQGQTTTGMATVQVSASNGVATKSGGGGGGTLSLYVLLMFVSIGCVRWIRPYNQWSGQRRPTCGQR